MKIKFRDYTPLKISTRPLVKGINPIELKKKRRGCVRVIASGPMDDNGFFNVSLYHEKTDKYFIKKMTKSQLTKALKNDGIESVWVDEEFEFGELIQIAQ